MKLDSLQSRVGSVLVLAIPLWIAGDSGPVPRQRQSTLAAASEAELVRLQTTARHAFDQGDHTDAEAAARTLLARTEATYGPRAEATAEALDLAVRCIIYGPGLRQSTSRRLAERAVEVRRDLHGALDARYAQSLCNLGILLQDSGDKKGALPLLERSLAITTRALGPQHPQVATVLAGIGDHFWSQGDLGLAIAKYEAAITILQATPDPDTLELTSIMNRAAINLTQRGDYVAARKYYERAIHLREIRYGPDHPRVTSLANNQATLLKEMGDAEAALQVFEGVLDNLRHTLADPEDPRIGIAMLSVASLTRPTAPERALLLYDSALQQLRRRLGEDADMVVKCMHGLGRTHRDLGHIDIAAAYFDSAAAASARAFSPKHWWVAFELRHLAGLHYDAGRIDAARAEADRALAIAENALEPSHPEMAEILGLRGSVRLALGDTVGAVENSLRAEEIAAAHLRLMARGFAEREALLYAAARPRGLDVPLGIVAAGGHAAQCERVWDIFLRSRAMVLDEMAFRSHNAALAHDTVTAQRVAEVRRTATLLARLVVAGPAGAPAAHAREVAAARRDQEAAERALAAHSSAFRRTLDRDRSGLAAIVSSRPAGSALVAFAEYARPSAPHPNQPLSGAGERHVLAFVLDPHGATHAVPIGAKDSVDACVRAWMREITRPVRDRRAGASLDAAIATGMALRHRVWDPIEPYLGDAPLVFVVPEGLLHRVNFAALPVEPGRFLIDTDRCLHILTAERDILDFAGATTPGAGMVAFGGADFDAPAAPEVQLASRRSTSTATPASTQPRRSAPLPPCGGLEGVRFPILPGSLREARLVMDTWMHALATRGRESQPTAPATLLTGADATETAFKTLAPGKEMVHLAIHAFVLNSECPAPSGSDTRGIHPLPPDLSEGSLHPLQLSGLVFARANQRDRIPLDQEDGILTAEEVVTLDLHGVQWAVLSACDTGVGEVQTGEGVLGLRRAFQIAGVQTLVMSLWSVSDAAACQWMEALYAARFGAGLGSAAAVHAATQNVLETRRRNGQSTHPYYWAAFVATGAWD